MDTLLRLLFVAGLALAVVVALPGGGFEKAWRSIFGEGYASSVIAAVLTLAILFAVSIGVLALVGDIAD